MARTGGQALVEALTIHGATHAFCVPGESYLFALDALYELDPDPCYYDAWKASIAVGELELKVSTAVADDDYATLLDMMDEMDTVEAKGEELSRSLDEASVACSE